LAKTARKLAVEAGDKKTALEAVTMLVERFADAKDIDPSAELKNGDYVWKQAQHATAGVKLDFQIQAAECYLKVKKAGTGLDKRLAEKRLGEIVNSGMPNNTLESRDIHMLIGTWDVKFTDDKHTRGQWTFYADGTAHITDGPRGKWRVEQNRIRVDWETGYWETLNRPLNPSGSQGDSRAFGDNSFTAKKANPKTLQANR
jgi:hypothetical protein